MCGPHFCSTYNKNWLTGARDHARERSDDRLVQRSGRKYSIEATM
jgi:hypothetical protein